MQPSQKLTFDQYSERLEQIIFNSTGNLTKAMMALKNELLQQVSNSQQQLTVVEAEKKRLQEILIKNKISFEKTSEKFPFKPEESKKTPQVK